MFSKIQSVLTSLCRQVRKEEGGFMIIQPRPQRNLKKIFSPSTYSEKIRWGREVDDIYN